MARPILATFTGNNVDLNYIVQHNPETCPYVFRVNQKFENKIHLERKEVDDVLGGEDAWKNVDKTTVFCTNLP